MPLVTKHICANVMSRDPGSHACLLASGHEVSRDLARDCCARRASTPCSPHTRLPAQSRHHLGPVDSNLFPRSNLNPDQMFIFSLIYSLQSSRYSKLEKADILEMTVKHLRSLQRTQLNGKCRFYMETS